jgi:hypothetical protein
MKISRANKQRHARLFVGHSSLRVWAIVEEVDGMRNSGLPELRKFGLRRKSGIPGLR